MELYRPTSRRSTNSNGRTTTIDDVAAHATTTTNDAIAYAVTNDATATTSL
jgi:hypothetical protein